MGVEDILSDKFAKMAKACLDKIPVPQTPDDYRKTCEALCAIRDGREITQLLPAYLANQVRDVKNLLDNPTLYVIGESDAQLFYHAVKSKIAERVEQLAHTLYAERKLVEVPQGGFALIAPSIEREAGHAVYGACSTGMSQCELLMLTNSAKGMDARLVFCHLDCPSRLNLLPELLKWVSADGAYQANILISPTSAYTREDFAAWAKSGPASDGVNFQITEVSENFVSAFTYLDVDGQFQTVHTESELPENYHVEYDEPRLNEGREGPGGENRLAEGEFDILENQKGYTFYSSPKYSSMNQIIGDFRAELTVTQEGLLRSNDQTSDSDEELNDSPRSPSPRGG